VVNILKSMLQLLVGLIVIAGGVATLAYYYQLP